MTDSAGEAARFLTRNAVDALPGGELERQLAMGRPIRVKLGVDPTTSATPWSCESCVSSRTWAIRWC